MTDLQRKFTDTRAEFKARLLQAGAHAWTRESAIAHLDDEVAKQYDGKSWSSHISLHYPVLAVFLGVEPYPTWNTSVVCDGGGLGGTRLYYTRGTHGHEMAEPLPQEAERIARHILKTMARINPRVGFEVSFVGKDPVLWAVPDYEHSRQNFLSPDAEPVCAWVGHGRNAKIIYPPY